MLHVLSTNWQMSVISNVQEGHCTMSTAIIQSISVTVGFAYLDRLFLLWYGMRKSTPLRKRWRMYILPECIEVGNSLKKRIDIFWRTDIRQEVIFFVVLRFHVIGCFSCHLFSVIYAWCLPCILVKCTCRHLFRYRGFNHAWSLQRHVHCSDHGVPVV